MMLKVGLGWVVTLFSGSLSWLGQQDANLLTDPIFSIFQKFNPTQIEKNLTLTFYESDWVIRVSRILKLDKLWDPHWFGRRTKHSLEGCGNISSAVLFQKHGGKYLLAVGLSRCKWYQSQTLGNVPVRRLFLKGVDTRQCASKDARSRRGFGGVLTLIGQKNKC